MSAIAVHIINGDMCATGDGNAITITSGVSNHLAHRETKYICPKRQLLGTVDQLLVPQRLELANEKCMDSGSCLLLVMYVDAIQRNIVTG